MDTDWHPRFPADAYRNGRRDSEIIHIVDDPHFDIFEWYPKHQSCQRYFLERAQYSAPVQALAAFVNILLPYQRLQYPTGHASRPQSSASSSRSEEPVRQDPNQPGSSPTQSALLLPFIRRLVVTGMDYPGVLHGFFGDDWQLGIGPLHEQERRNYLFAAKSGGWASVKRDYDILPLETVPFLRPLQAPAEVEIEGAERGWSQWLAMEDWMIGPRAPATTASSAGSPSSEEC